MTVQPAQLEGQHVRLLPLQVDHIDALCSVGLDEELWKLIPTMIRSHEDMQRYVEQALKERHEGQSLPFVIVEKKSGTIVGSTRFANIERSHKRMEIGWTWIARPWQQTAVNTETKYLLLTYAFETLGCIRVEFKTDALNQQSRKAILRIGAKEEGIFRNHMITQSGRIRDTVYFSIIDSEWQDVKKLLTVKLKEHNV